MCQWESVLYVNEIIFCASESVFSVTWSVFCLPVKASLVYR